MDTITFDSVEKLQSLQLTVNLLEQLPPELLAHVLQHVDLKQRLTSCALVNSAWSRAATEATSIRHTFQKDSAINSLNLALAWLHKYGQHVTSIDLSAPSVAPTLEELPCLHLQQLKLSRFKLQLGPGDGSTTCHQDLLLAPGCKDLTRLHLDSCAFVASSQTRSSDGLACLGRLRSLEHLELRDLARTAHGMRSSTMPSDRPTFPGTLLQQLVRLTHLSLSNRWLDDSSLQHISCVAGLRELRVRWMFGAREAALSSLQGLQQLTLLDISGPCLKLTPSSTPWLSMLTALQHLKLIHAGSLDPILLANMTWLQCLNVRGTSLSGDTAGTAALLAVLPRLQQLHHLVLASSLKCRGLVTTSSYSALTSSKQLQHLDLSGCHMPAAAWQHLFLEGQQLPQLQVLRLNHTCFDPDSNSPTNEFLTGHRLQQLVDCCHGLHSLGLESENAPSNTLIYYLLERLPALSSLSVSNIDDAAARVLGVLTGLRELRLDYGPHLSPAGLLKLTALSLLEKLDIEVSREFRETYFLADTVRSAWGPAPMWSASFTGQAAEGHPPDVYIQLLRACNDIKGCDAQQDEVQPVEPEVALVHA